MTQDRIVYVIESAPGGQDEMDNSDKGGTIVAAYFDRGQAEKHIGQDSRYVLKPQVIDFTQAEKDALAKLNPIEKLVLGFGPKPKHVTRGGSDDR